MIVKILALDLIMSICSPKPLAIGGTGNFTPTCIAQGHELCHRSGENPSDDDVDKLSNECCEPSTRLTLTCPTGNTNLKTSTFDCEQRSGDVDHVMMNTRELSPITSSVSSTITACCGGMSHFSMLMFRVVVMLLCAWFLYHV